MKNPLLILHNLDGFIRSTINLRRFEILEKIKQCLEISNSLNLTTLNRLQLTIENLH